VFEKMGDKDRKEAIKKVSCMLKSVMQAAADTSDQRGLPVERQEQGRKGGYLGVSPPACRSHVLALIISIDLKNEGKVSKGPAKKAGEYPLNDQTPTTAIR
jgi:hypothetical protein